MLMLQITLKPRESLTGLVHVHAKASTVHVAAAVDFKDELCGFLQFEFDDDSTRVVICVRNRADFFGNLLLIKSHFWIS